MRSRVLCSPGAGGIFWGRGVCPQLLSRRLGKWTQGPAEARAWGPACPPSVQRPGRVSSAQAAALTGTGLVHGRRLECVFDSPRPLWPGVGWGQDSVCLYLWEAAAHWCPGEPADRQGREGERRLLPGPAPREAPSPAGTQ